MTSRSWGIWGLLESRRSERLGVKLCGCDGVGIGWGKAPGGVLTGIIVAVPSQLGSAGSIHHRPHCGQGGQRLGLSENYGICGRVPGGGRITAGKGGGRGGGLHLCHALSQLGGGWLSPSGVRCHQIAGQGWDKTLQCPPVPPAPPTLWTTPPAAPEPIPVVSGRLSPQAPRTMGR